MFTHCKYNRFLKKWIKFIINEFTYSITKFASWLCHWPLSCWSCHLKCFLLIDFERRREIFKWLTGSLQLWIQFVMHLIILDVYKLSVLVIYLLDLSLVGKMFHMSMRNMFYHLVILMNECFCPIVLKWRLVLPVKYNR